MSDPYEGGNFGGGKKRTKADGPPESYAEVKERIQVFYAHYPTGRLVTGDIRIFESEPGEVVRVMVQAKAYRTPEDEMPGIGTSWMVVPGKTPYTNGSELENCETSAWGRALAAIGILVDKGIASAQEIRSKQTEDHEPPSKPTAPATALAEAAAKAVKEVREGLNKSDLTEAPKTAPEPAKEPKTPKGAATPAPVKEDATESVGDEAAMLDAAIAAADAGGGTGRCHRRGYEGGRGRRHRRGYEGRRGRPGDRRNPDCRRRAVRAILRRV